MSEKDCRNDCTVPLRFPRRPGTNFFIGTGEDCFCCKPNERISADNRPSLPRFNYRIGTYANIREFLLHGINHAPNLRGWTHREADDPAIALLEGAAILGNILTFYQETYANEAFLRTAQWRESIGDLVRLLGYRLSPALGGNATFAFELKKDEAVTIPAGFPVKATLEELEQPAEFETNKEIKAYPWLSRFNLFKPLQTPNIDSATTEFYIANQNAEIEIKAGDRLLVGDKYPSSGSIKRLEKAEIVIVDSVRQLHGIKLITIKGNLQKRDNSVNSIQVCKLGRAFHHFGHNGPLTKVNMPISIPGKISEEKISFSRQLASQTCAPSRDSRFGSVLNRANLNLFSGENVGGSNQPTVDFGAGLELEIDDSPIRSPGNFVLIVAPCLEANEFPLDSEVQDLPNGGAFIVEITSSPTVTTIFVGKIKNIRSGPFTWGLLSGTTSIVTLTDNLNTNDLDPKPETADIRQMLFHEVLSPTLTLKASPVEFSPAPTNKVLAFYGLAEQAEDLKERRIMFAQAGEEAKIVTVTDITTPENNLPQMHYVEISDGVDYADFPQQNPFVTVYGNLADADEGKTLPEAVLGNGDNTTIFQTFKLPKSPLTYHLNTVNTPPETPELEIYVGGRLWQKVENFFGRGTDEEIYIVREDAENNSWVQFGDGKTGLRLPTGIKNVSAIYRIGAGAFGELKADTKVQASAKLKNLDKIQMPQAATGGTEAESGENAKNAAPGKIQSLGRLVSLRDFETETAAMPGVALVSAAWSLVDNIPSVVITVLMETGRSGEITSIEETLNGYNSGRGASRFPIKVVPGKRLYVYVAAEYALNATFRADLVEPEIRKMLGVNFGKATNKEDQSGLFSLRNRRFGGREYASTIEGKIQAAAGVIWARVTAFSALSDADDPESITLPGENVFQEIGSHVLSLYDKHLFLTQTAREGN